MSKKIIIYKATAPTGKSYIGITGRGLLRRKVEHLRSARMGSTGLLHKAIRKYGKEIVWEILEESSSYEEAFLRERYFIILFNTFADGYNLTRGGEGVVGGVPWCKGLQHTDITKIKISQSKGVEDFAVYELSTKTCIGTWQCQSICAKDLGLSFKAVSGCLNETKKRWKNYIFIYLKNIDNLEKLLSIKVTFKNRKIKGYRKGQFIGEWANQKECAEALGIPRFGISQVLNKKIKITRGYTFEAST